MAIVDRVTPLDRSTRLHGHKITKAWQASVESIIEVGRLLIEAKGELPHGEFEVMVKQCCPFGKRTAQTLMQIASHPVIAKAQHVAHLPNAWGTLGELARFEPAELSHAIGNHWVKPEMTREDVKYLRARTQKALGTRTRMPARPKRESVEPAESDSDLVPWPKKPAAQVKAETRKASDLFQLFDALEALSGMPMQPSEFPAFCPDYQTYRVDEHLDAACEWLNQFQKEWQKGKRSGLLRRIEVVE